MFSLRLVGNYWLVDFKMVPLAYLWLLLQFNVVRHDRVMNFLREWNVFLLRQIQEVERILYYGWVKAFLHQLHLFHLESSCDFQGILKDKFDKFAETGEEGVY